MEFTTSVYRDNIFLTDNAPQTMNIAEISQNLSYVNDGTSGEEQDILTRLRAFFTLRELVRFFMAVTAIVLNVIILLALALARKRITTHYQLVVSLAVSDMLVGGSVVLHVGRQIFSPVMRAGTANITTVCLHIIFKSLNTIGLNVNLMNLMTISCDHYVAIMRPLKYGMIMTKTRIKWVILAIWTISVILGFSDFFSAIQSDETYSGQMYCKGVQLTLYQEEYTVFAIAPICLGIIIYVYTRIYITIRKHKVPGQETRRETQRHTKAFITTLLNVTAFVVSWLPLWIFEVTTIILVTTDPLTLMQNEETLMAMNYHLYNLLIMHAIADPIIYTVRMKEVGFTFS